MRKKIKIINSIITITSVLLSFGFFRSKERLEEHSSQSKLFSNNSLLTSNIYSFYERIGLDKAWQITTGSNTISVGIMDTGFNQFNPALQGNIDTTLSYDFFDENRGPFDNLNLSHGTDVACRLGGNGINGLYYSGVTRNSNLIALRVDGNTFPYNENLLAVCMAFYYAEANNIPIINFSGGFYESDINFNSKILLQAAVNNYSGLIVCAAGNGNESIGNPEMYDIDSDGHKLYPACFTNDNILVVGGTKENSDELNNGLTNYGTTSVDLFAPGGDGTSLAAPLVAGTAALMLSIDSSLTATQLKQKILTSVDIISGYENYCFSHGRLNVLKSLQSVLPAICEGTTTSLSQIEYGQNQWYRFISGYGIYTFETTGSLDTCGFLYNNNLAGIVCSSSSGGSGDNFLFTCLLSPGAYYLKINLNSYSLPDYYNIVISNHPHSYNDHYSSNGPKGHNSYCLCGDYKVLPHIYPTDINGNKLPCVVCGFSLNGGLLANKLGVSIGNGSYIYEDGTICLSYNDYIRIIQNDYFKGDSTWENILNYLL